jgi:hypothetical protein
MEVTRRHMLSLFGIAGAILAIPTADTDALTSGMERRQERRGVRVDRRYERRGGQPANKQPTQGQPTQSQSAASK